MTGAAQAIPVTPNFTSGTITSETNSKTTVVETIRQQDFSNGYTYVVTGTNVQVNQTDTPVPAIPPVPGNGTTAPATPTCIPSSGTICYGSTFSVINPGQPFQLTETYNGPGIFRETAIDRTTTQESRTISTSVFTQ
jgi:hypothetical protein